MTFKVIIAGSRDFADYNLLAQRCDHLLSQVTEPIEVVSGTARGADRLGVCRRRWTRLDHLGGTVRWRGGHVCIAIVDGRGGGRPMIRNRVQHGENPVLLGQLST